MKFFRKHHKWLSILGAAIVFVTYFIKERLREQSKDQLDAITGAQNSYTQRTTEREIIADLERVQYAEEESKLDLPKLKTTARTYYDVKSQLRGNVYVVDYQAMLGDVAPLTCHFGVNFNSPSR